MNDNEWGAPLDFAKIRPKKVYGVAYGEYGYEIIGGQPPIEDIPKIEAESKIRMAEARAQRIAVDAARDKLYEDLWAIDHPIRTFFNWIWSKLG